MECNRNHSDTKIPEVMKFTHASELATAPSIRHSVSIGVKRSHGSHIIVMAQLPIGNQEIWERCKFKDTNHDYRANQKRPEVAFGFRLSSMFDVHYFFLLLQTMLCIVLLQRIISRLEKQGS